MRIPRSKFLAAVEALVGTPTGHRGRLPGVCLDCVGVPIAALRSCGVRVEDYSNYGMLPSSGELRAGLRAYCDEVDIATRAPGDILAMLEGSDTRHVAVIASPVDGVETVVMARGLRVRRRRIASVLDSVTSCWRVRGIC